MSARISGMNFDIYMLGQPIHVEAVSLSISDNSAAATSRGVPDGFVDGDVSAEGELEVDAKNFGKIKMVAAAVGSYRDLPLTDLVFFAKRGGERQKVEAFGCKLIVTDLLDVDPKGGSKATRKIKYFVTSPDFVHIDGVPYLSNYDTRDLIG
ncbi:phage protein [Avibacterium paragallinarum]|uniref:phage protein n=1 Tax=Avibacterium paragallinarum TaxID=728 RepID=UPI00188FF24E|nr:phage protein [Avibacterium paragallinarum]